ncbi:MAG: CvpA family protein [Lewinellaceae bacterium]|nr:CvpA family protein [Saprospiraceae bacterium]MCB9308308.1 CvpA family protein [Lewinellaceae bacterium]MCB9353518.1 CvpA family protein [Lewinellaceae bacterium]
MPIDLIFVIVFGFGFRHGYTQGIISTVFNVLAYLFGITLAFKITPVTTNILERMFNSNNPSMFLLGFIVNVGLIMFMLRATSRAFETALTAVYLGFFNRVLGGAIMAGLSVLIYSVLLWFAVKVQFINDATIAQSRTYPILKDIPGKAKSIAIRFKPMATEIWDSSMQWMDGVEKFGLEKTENQSQLYDVPEGENPDIDREPQQSAPSRQPITDDDGIEE